MRKALPTRTAVLDVLASEEGPIHAREVAARLEVAPASFDGLMRILDDLVFQGAAIARGQRYELDRKVILGGKKGVEKAHGDKPHAGASPRSRGRTVERREGLVKINPRGFGFVASPTASGDDVFVPAESIGSAMNGDTVVVEIVGRSSRGAEGQIVEVLKRSTPRISGLLRRRGKSAWVEPDDPRVRGPVVLTREIDLAGPEGNSGVDGQVVVVEITRFPDTQGENPEGKLVAVLGAPGELSVEVRKVLFLEQIEEVHSSQAIEEAEAYGLEVPLGMLEGREDLTAIPLPTIDPEDARDHDDAVWVERTESGGYEVWIAIADVSSYVRPETKLDEESKARGCSIYLPDRAIPMLPRALSSNLCSLLPDVVRLCLCVHAELDAKGHVKKSRVIRGFMKSAAKLTYGGVARALGFTPNPPRQEQAEEMVEGLRVAHECSRLLRTQRMKRGALDFDLPEPVVKLSDDGQPISVTKRAQDPGVKKAYQLIEELMIFANEVVARWLIERSLPGIFRVHLPPDPQKLARLAAMCELLGVELELEGTQTPKGLSALLKSFADHPNANVLNNLLLRSMKQATYDVSNLGHFGLASQAYLHFTSPIRRYPDLVVHRIVHAALEGNERDRRKALNTFADQDTLVDAALASSTAERRAMEVEREILDVYRCFYMVDHVGERFEGTVSAFVGSGAFITLDEPFVDVMVKVEDMGGDFQIEEDGLMATSRRTGNAIRLGDKLLVDISDVAILRRTIYARLASAGARQDSYARPQRAGGNRSGFGRPPQGKQRGFDPRDGEKRAGRHEAREGRPAREGEKRAGRYEGRDAQPARGKQEAVERGRAPKPGRPAKPLKPGKSRGEAPAAPGKRNKGGPGPVRAKKAAGKKKGRR